MARPDDLSYVIRREAYDRILKAFTANGIRFAERRVSVSPLPSTGAGAIPGFAAAAQKLGIHYPVVQENDCAIWNRYSIRGWPTTLLVDRQGTLRYRHIGEGAYKETGAMIQRLLAEKN